MDLEYAIVCTADGRVALERPGIPPVLMAPDEACKRAFWASVAARRAKDSSNGCKVDLVRLCLSPSRESDRIDATDALLLAVDLFAAGCGWQLDAVSDMQRVGLAAPTDALAGAREVIESQRGMCPPCHPCHEIGGES